MAMGRAARWIRLEVDAPEIRASLFYIYLFVRWYCTHTKTIMQMLFIDAHTHQPYRTTR